MHFSLVAGVREMISASGLSNTGGKKALCHLPMCFFFDAL